MSTRITYRPEIDGLRTIAVISVILFHARFSLGGINPIEGGYLGVDVFFVISGYLISSLLLKGLEEGSFSFRDFYSRRARRILPILFTVMAVSLPAAWFLLLPQEMIEYSNSIIYSILFSSNIWFWSEDPYWATDSSLKPFLHTWSLAVEEQFYLVMPIILIALHKFMRAAMPTALAVLGIASLVFAHWASGAYPEFAFYMLPARMWELLGGTLLAIAERHHSRNSLGWMTTPFPALGIALVCVPFFFFDEHTRHPSLLTLIPIAGTMMIIWFAHDGEITTRVLASRPFVGIGLLSYGLYLWHYPIFAFGRMIVDEPTNLHRAAWIALAFAVTVTTYFLIEKPFRNRQRIGNRAGLVTGALAMSLCLGFSASSLTQTGYGKRFAALQSIYGVAEPSNQLLGARTYEIHEKKANFASEDTYNIAVFGDSHAKNIFNALYLNQSLYPGYDFIHLRFTVSSDEGCLLDDPDVASRLTQHPGFRLSDHVVISERFRDQDNQYACLEKLIGILKAHDKAATLLSLSNIFEVGNSGFLRKQRRAIIMRIAKEDYFSRLYLSRDEKRLTTADLYFWQTDNVSKRVYEKHHFRSVADEVDVVNRQLGRIARSHGIPFLRKQDYLCDAEKKRCPFLDKDEHKLFYDQNHMTLEGARYFGRIIHDLEWFEGLGNAGVLLDGDGLREVPRLVHVGALLQGHVVGE